MKQFLRSQWWRSILSHGVVLAAGIALAMAFAPSPTQFTRLILAPPRQGPASEFHRALQTVMIQMDAEMCITPSANPDRDFARAMIPHHQGAVEMAKLELLYGNDPHLRRLAQLDRRMPVKLPPQHRRRTNRSARTTASISVSSFRTRFRWWIHRATHWSER